MKFFKSTFSINNLTTAAFVFAIAWVVSHPDDWLWLLYMLLWEKIVIATLSKEIAHHRYFCHKSFKTGKIRHYFLMLCTVFGPGDSISISMIHRKHHICADTDADPQRPDKSIVRLFSYTFLTDRMYDKMKSMLKDIQTPRDLMRDSKLVFLHKHSSKLFTALCIITLPFCWKFVVFVMLAGRRLFHINNIICGLILTHTKLPGGYQGFDTKDNSYNTPWLGYFHPGEAYHNNHHFKPSAWNFAMKPGEFDMVGWIIGRVFLQR